MSVNNIPQSWRENAPKGSYLENLVSWYNQGKYIEMNYGIFIYQTGLKPGSVFTYLVNKGVRFLYKPSKFKTKGGEIVHAKSKDMIVLCKHLRPDKEYINQKSH